MTTTTIPGIDVSSYQPENYPITGAQFVAIKATEGTTYTNAHMRGQLARARAANAPVIFYHFLHPGKIRQQVRYFLDQAPEDGRDGLAIDWETLPNGSAATCKEKDQALEAVKAIDRRHRVLLYCNRDFWLTRDTTSYCGDGLWIADYDAPAGHPRIKHPHVIHQYGVRASLDRDVAQFATKAAMAKWLHA